MNREQKLESALRGLRRIVEEVGCGDWRDQNGQRFKDTPEWVHAYVVLHSAEQDMTAPKNVQCLVCGASHGDGMQCPMLSPSARHQLRN